MLTKAAETSELLPGGMKAVTLGGRELVLCNWEGAFYAVERACGHANARLERGALTGWILTCPLHYAQFDIRSGEALSGPAPKAPDSKHPDPADPALATRSLRTYPVKVENGVVYVDLP
ncbi:MAG: naphthalene 1,2-dioxygenase [Elusimicrobia bacterium HGW-Elusimicrobia-3]|jgi:3-phenylpropionate/trans-cinnamate dioxygenase ferredoxin subunit/naphthalene 1,2-dioxygenase system ferredoxin subunit|nr:MAG: naphthalene 1,2-dioxygenase [Elusimicrobia bacterium HGW-Elusimicrobia-3]